MAKTVGDFVVERLRTWGVRRVFGFPGDGINGIMAAFEHEGDERPRFIQARHEEMAAFMAGAHAKFTGEPGVCLATSGPGAIHLLNGLYDAAMDHQPVVAIVGQSATTALGGDYQQEVDLQTLFKDVAAEFCMTVASPAAMRHCVDRAIRVALDQRSVTCIIVPKDVQEMDAVTEQPHEHGTVHSA
ncbi:MAG TPA: thiamine pyrophosphate-binding protein, partial [Myxococcales bacterium]|nr:thiamine pyrophosphate-binding protein [Myxococcales bacterium]